MGEVDINKEGLKITTKNKNFASRHIHNPLRVENTGEVVCSDCGLVLEERCLQIDKHPRIFSPEEVYSKQHYGTPITPLLPDLQMATMVNKREAKTRILKKALRWDTRYNWKQRNLMIAISEIKRIGTHLHVPSRVEEYASMLYRKALKQGLLKGRSIKAMVAACVYYASKSDNVPSPLHEIEKRSEEDRRKITICYNSIQKRLNLKSAVLDPLTLIPKAASNLGLSQKIETMIAQVIRAYKKCHLLSGKDPKGVAAAAMYYIIKKRGIYITQNDIVEELGVTEVTMRKRYKEIIDMIRKIKQKKNLTFNK